MPMCSDESITRHKHHPSAPVPLDSSSPRRSVTGPVGGSLFYWLFEYLDRLESNFYGLIPQDLTTPEALAPESDGNYSFISHFSMPTTHLHCGASPGAGGAAAPTTTSISMGTVTARADSSKVVEVKQEKVGGGNVVLETSARSSSPSPGNYSHSWPMAMPQHWARGACGSFEDTEARDAHWDDIVAVDDSDDSVIDSVGKFPSLPPISRPTATTTKAGAVGYEVGAYGGGDEEVGGVSLSRLAWRKRKLWQAVRRRNCGLVTAVTDGIEVSTAVIFVTEKSLRR